MSAATNSFGPQKKILMVVANPGTHPTLKYPVGFWASELTHPWLAFTEAGYALTLASPNGGKVAPDGYSDPRDPSRYSAHDIISMGYLHTPAFVKELETTRALEACKASEFDAIFVAGGQGPMFQFREDRALIELVRQFYEAGKVTAVVCHGTCVLLDVKLASGKLLIEGKTMTGFANSEEDAAKRAAGIDAEIFPFRIENEARRRGANFVQAGTWKPFAVRDGNLITGQQQYSGAKAAELVIAALGA